MEALRVRAVDGSPPVLQVEGEIDVSTADELRAELEKALSNDPSVVVDFAGVTFCDAAGLRVVIQAAGKLNGSGPLTLVHAKRVKWLLDLVGLADLPTIHIRDDCDAP